ncbi:hypothetical protein SAMN04489724_2267 [Algoriphagus locisalis]|uniref:Four-helix bundle copper-binding protein n=1 Tax=Algoriphagus locisalis TaxID=305507 RepID=A0A1I7BBK3_9BACT|nr:hypothetical protein [Algoriphagus locisalis]SFT84442.1 hypothetical protein SAMN04489724_2267 [Algoriphagus locisalis]
MTSLTPLKSDLCNALEQCIKDVQLLISTIKHGSDMKEFIAVAEHCLEACMACLDACESGRFDRGIMMADSAEACALCADQCESLDLPESRKCLASCKICLEELFHLLA